MEKLYHFIKEKKVPVIIAFALVALLTIGILTGILLHNHAKSSQVLAASAMLAEEYYYEEAIQLLEDSGLKNKKNKRSQKNAGCQAGRICGI